MFALISIAGVVALGVLQGVVIAIGATLIHLLMEGMRPRDAMLGRIPGRDGFYKLHRYPNAPGLAIYLLQGSLLFFNVDFIKSRIESIFADLAPGTKWFIFDAGATAQIDSTAASMLDSVFDMAAQHGLKFAIVELHSEPLNTLVRSGLVVKVGPDMIFDDLEDAIGAFAANRSDPLV